MGYAVLVLIMLGLLAWSCRRRWRCRSARRRAERVNAHLEVYWSSTSVVPNPVLVARPHAPRHRQSGRTRTWPYRSGPRSPILAHATPSAGVGATPHAPPQP